MMGSIIQHGVTVALMVFIVTLFIHIARRK